MSDRMSFVLLAGSLKNLVVLLCKCFVLDPIAIAIRSSFIHLRLVMAALLWQMHRTVIMYYSLYCMLVS